MRIHFDTEKDSAMADTARSMQYTYYARAVRTVCYHVKLITYSVKRKTLQHMPHIHSTLSHNELGQLLIRWFWWPFMVVQGQQFC